MPYELGKTILKTLTENNFQAFFVGGFVRDRLLGFKTEDIDICTDATPEEVKKLFPSSLATGEKYGTMTVFIDQYRYEITTFRAERNYQDNRHPGNIVFETELAGDLGRRDFTINAMAMGLAEEVIDLFSGRQDLKQRLIRAIGDPLQRFKEDALRILRAFRFVAKLDFELEAATKDAIELAMPLLGRVANERIRVELTQIRQYPFRQKAIRLMVDLGIGNVFPEIVPGLDFLANKANLSLTESEFYALCFYLANTDIPDKWRFSRVEKRQINAIIAFLKQAQEGSIDWEIVYQHKLATSLSGEKLLVGLKPTIYKRGQVQSLWQSLPIKKVSDLALGGNDLKEYFPGNDKAIGEWLALAVKLVNSTRIPNEKIALLDYLKQHFRK